MKESNQYMHFKIINAILVKIIIDKNNQGNS